MPTPTSLKKTVLLIGASRGLGFAMAEELLKRGDKVIATLSGQNCALVIGK